VSIDVNLPDRYLVPLKRVIVLHGCWLTNTVARWVFRGSCARGIWLFEPPPVSHYGRLFAAFAFLLGEAMPANSIVAIRVRQAVVEEEQFEVSLTSLRRSEDATFV
jgi:hypothetical protein